MNMKRIAVTFFLLSQLTAVARMGENITQCDQRYNVGGGNISSNFMETIPPLISGPDTKSIVYHHDGWSIKIGYLSDVAVVLEYTRLDSRQIEDSQVSLILNANSRGQKWTRAKHDLWIRTDGSSADPSSHHVRLESAAYKRYLNQAQQEQERLRPKPGTQL